MKKGLIWGVFLLVVVGGWVTVSVFEFWEQESALRQKNVKTALAEQQRCEAGNSKFRTYEQFRARFKAPFVSDLAPERWAEQFSSLKDGMSEREVERILGAPEYARCELNKDGDHFAGSKWGYEIVVPQDLANDSQNSAIEVVFGPDGKLKEKNAMNMQSRPGPTPAPNPEATPAVAPASTPAPVVTPTPETAAPTPSATPEPTPSPSPETMHQ